MNFKEIPLSSFDMNPFDLIGKEGMLITAGNESSFNTMTAAWGQMGFIWRQPVATIYVRPQRYTKEFLDATDDFTLSFLGPSGEHALHICGTQSGRDSNKVQEAGITPASLGDVMTFEEAQLVFVCHKIYAQPIDPQAFCEQSVSMDCYPAKDFSVQYVGRIEHVYIREDLYQHMSHMMGGAEGGCCGHGEDSCTGHGPRGHQGKGGSDGRPCNGHGHHTGHDGCCNHGTHEEDEHQRGGCCGRGAHHNNANPDDEKGGCCAHNH